MIEYHSSDMVIANLRNALQGKSDPLDWISIELAALERDIGSIRQRVHRMHGRRQRRGGMHVLETVSRICLSRLGIDRKPMPRS
jgi:hypothetical protein